ncbi:hypothetical protein GE21DRAFT_1223804, partial [Neurospora crassa]
FYYTFINNIIIFSNNKNDYIKYLKTIFELFIYKGITILLKKSFLGFLNVELLKFRIDSLGLFNTKDRIIVFKALKFL